VLGAKIVSAYDDPIGLAVISSVGAGNKALLGALKRWACINVVCDDQDSAPSSQHEPPSKPIVVTMNYCKYAFEQIWVELYGFYALGDLPSRRVHAELWTRMSGCILLLDSTQPHTFRPNKQYLDELLSVMELPAIVVANKQDLPNALPPQDIAAILGVGKAQSVLPCVALDESSVRTIVFTLLHRILPAGENTSDLLSSNF
jgi:signal recognition particle receptor subunit beta